MLKNSLSSFDLLSMRPNFPLVTRNLSIRPPLPIYANSWQKKKKQKQKHKGEKKFEKRQKNENQKNCIPNDNRGSDTFEHLKARRCNPPHRLTFEIIRTTY